MGGLSVSFPGCESPTKEVGMAEKEEAEGAGNARKGTKQ